MVLCMLRRKNALKSCSTTIFHCRWKLLKFRSHFSTNIYSSWMFNVHCFLCGAIMSWRQTSRFIFDSWIHSVGLNELKNMVRSVMYAPCIYIQRRWKLYFMSWSNWAFICSPDGKLKYDDCVKHFIYKWIYLISRYIPWRHDVRLMAAPFLSLCLCVCVLMRSPSLTQCTCNKSSI